MFWVELGSTPIHGDVDLFNVDLCGRAVLSDHGIHAQHLWVELGSAPMRAKAANPLHNWADQLPVWLTCFAGGRPHCNKVTTNALKILTRLCFG